MKALQSMEYAGRLVILGSTPNDSNRDIIVYGVTGRSEPSRERRFIWHSEGRLEVQSIKEEEKNDPLRNYNALIHDDGIAISNGKQTDLISRGLAVKDKTIDPQEMFKEIFARTELVGDIDVCSYEPDKPNYTPRIGGATNEMGQGLFRVSKLGDGAEKLVNSYDLDIEAGFGHLITTYQGTNVPSGVRIPSSTGKPALVELPWTDAKTIAEAVYEALGPKTGEGILEPGKDFRVGVAALIYNVDKNTIDDMFIVNRHS